MDKPEAIVFDLGKVLVDFDYGLAANRVAARGELSPAETRRFLDQGPLHPSYERGEITTSRFYEAIVAGTKFSGTLEEFSLFFSDIFSPIDAMIEIHSRLRQRGFPTYVFSNTNDLAIRHIRGAFPFYAEFDDYILSYEHGAMKPDPKLYDVVEARTGRHGPKLLYLDDRPENIEAGRARNWQVILQESPQKTLAQFQSLGLL